MDVPNIDEIAASLRSCSLGGGADRTPSPPLPGKITVDLNSEIPLPCHWEQRLDMKTGEIYYVNWETGARTILDPRSAGTSTYSSSYYYSDEDEDEVPGTRSVRDGYEEEEEEEEGCDEIVDSDEDEAFATGSSRNGCDEEEEKDSAGDDDEETLIAAGCNACFIYLMVPKGAPVCLKCGGALIHLGDYL